MMPLPAEVLITVATISAAVATALAIPRRPRWPVTRVGPTPGAASAQGWLLRYRWLWCAFSAAGGVFFAPRLLAVPVAAALAVGIWVVIGRAEPLAIRTEREQAHRQMVPLVGLIAAALSAGAPPGHALQVACEAMPGAAAARLDVVRAQLALGSEAADAWRCIADDEILAPLGRAITRADRTGAPLALTITRLAQELAATSRAEVEDRARVVGVKAAVPLGLCLLPSFLLIGIVPVAAGLLASLT
jgi:Flp pilus assembly protein TadB